jgi:hypothetical protein
MLLGGCQRQLASADFLRRYEQECMVTVERGGYRFLLMYQSPEYLAALGGGPEAKPEEIGALAESYSRAHYIRISIRPIQAGAGNGAAAAAFGSDPLLPQVVLGERLKAAEPGLSKRIRLRASDGREIEAASAVLQRGLKTGAGNAILAVFPRESKGERVDLDDWELEIDDLGLNLGTLRKRLSLPKGFRLKVAA